MASGVKVVDEVKDVYNELKNKHLHNYVVFRLSEDMKQIEVDKTSLKSEDKYKSMSKDDVYAEFVAHMMEVEVKKECRYGIYDVSYEVNNSKKEKVVMIYWAPETAKIKQKMVYASSLAALKTSLGSGLHATIQACDCGDLAWSNVLEVCQKHQRD